MLPVWLGACALVSAAVPASPDAGASLFSSAPAECERVRAAIDAAKDSGFIAPQPLRELARGDCVRAIATGRWPELTSALAGSEIPARRGVLCTLGPPEAAPILEAWLSHSNVELDDPACALALLRVAPPAFSRVVNARLFSGDMPKQVDEFVFDIAARMDPDERIALLPALQKADAYGLAGRDKLRSTLCEVGPARFAPACTTPGPELAEPRYDHEKLRSALRNFWPHGLVAVAYAALAIAVQRKRGRAALPVPLVSLGTVAFFVLASLAMVNQTPTGGGAVGGLQYMLTLLVAVPLAVLAGFLIPWFALRGLRIPPAHWCVVQALLYIPLAFYYEWTNL